MKQGRPNVTAANKPPGFKDCVVHSFSVTNDFHQWLLSCSATGNCPCFWPVWTPPATNGIFYWLRPYSATAIFLCFRPVRTSPATNDFCHWLRLCSATAPNFGFRPVRTSSATSDVCYWLRLCSEMAADSWPCGRPCRFTDPSICTRGFDDETSVTCCDCYSARCSSGGLDCSKRRRSTGHNHRRHRP